METPEKIMSFSKKIIKHLGIVSSLTRREALSHIADGIKKTTRPQRRFNEWMEFMAGEMDIFRVEGMDEVIVRTAKAVWNYHPSSRLRAPLILICDAARAALPGYNKAPSLGWAEYSQGEVDIRLVAVRHVDMFQPEFVGVVAEAVGDALAATAGRAETE